MHASTSVCFPTPTFTLFCAVAALPQTALNMGLSHLPLGASDRSGACLSIESRSTQMPVSTLAQSPFQLHLETDCEANNDRFYKHSRCLSYKVPLLEHLRVCTNGCPVWNVILPAQHRPARIMKQSPGAQEIEKARTSLPLFSATLLT